MLINTTTIVTFIMVFIIQSTQNRDVRALQTKHDAFLVALEGDHGHLIGLEDLPEKVIKKVQVEVHEGSVDVESRGGGAEADIKADGAEIEVSTGAEARGS